ncbi:ATP-dependent DNA helicase pif1-like [Bactrocera neohumeralis]|uniref:ATP-dependent DNA helicase pif1-like n=1 Tax=Bactrocera neohumeralis TaxID=98809 RepID=UPI002165AD72|nr:ATP-dependent DNA helicase pif1-like [Bactrocera neohumeralis]
MHGRTCQHFCLPQPTIVDQPNILYNVEQERQYGQEAFSKLNQEQTLIVEEVLSSVRNESPNCYFIDEPGGSGETFIYTALCHILRGENKVVLPVAWTGIAANLLPGGRTSHALFKLPVPILDTSVSSMRPNSKEAQLLRKTDLFIWDEVSMVPKDAINIVDKLFKDITNVNLPFGGKIFVFGGDFRQVLPVVRHATRTSIIENCIKRSPLWSKVKIRRLVQNMRANNDPEFKNWLLKLGNGDLEIQHEISEDTIKIPRQYYADYDNLIAKVYGTNEINDSNISKFYSTAILCPKNDECSTFNEYIVSKLLPGDIKIYLSCDTVEKNESYDAQCYPTEFLNSLNPSGLPPHKLILKKNTIVMLIRNLNAKEGLINGARMVVSHLGENAITVKLIDSGKIAIIPRVKLTPSDPTVPFQMTRKQFPLKVAFAMTINKAQGQTFDKAGLYLPSPVFSHGQLYVAFSRVRRFEDITFSAQATFKQKIENEFIFTSNIVFKEVL